jgi:O-antigen ligase
LAWLATASTAAAVSLSAAVLLLAACFVWPAAIMAAAFPASFATWRVGPAAVDMSAADLIAFLGAVASLPFVPWHGRAFRSVLLASVGYCAVVSVAVVAHPSSTAGIEVVHRFVMVMGAVCIGGAIVRTGHVTAALRGLVVVASAVSLAAIVDTLSNGLHPAYAFGLAKNSLGVLLAMTLMVILFAASHLEWSRRTTTIFGLVSLLGLAATQSRGAWLALVMTLGVYAIRTGWRGDGRRLAKFAPLFLVVVLGLSALAVVSFQSQDAALTGTSSKYTSINSRQLTYQATIDNVIKPHPIFGAGPKWFTKPGAPATEPHNLLLDELASTGVLGLAAFVLFLVAFLHIAGRNSSMLARLAWYALLARILASMVDIFWVAGPNTLPFLLVGLAIGAEATDESVVRRPRLVRAR